MSPLTQLLQTYPSYPLVVNLPFNATTKMVWDKIYRDHAPKLPFFTFEWYFSWMTTLGSVYKPYILLSNYVLAPFIRKGNEVSFLDSEVTDYTDLIGSDYQKIIQWQYIIDYLKNDGVKKLKLKNIPADSPTVVFSKNLLENKRLSDYKHIRIEADSTTPVLKLPKSFESYIPFMRERPKRYFRKFKRIYPLSQIVTSKNPKRDLEAFFYLMRKHQDKNKFLTPTMESFFRELVNTHEQSVKLFFLLVNGEKIASLFNFATDNKMVLYNSCCDKTNFSNSGTYLTVMSIKNAIEEDFDEYNFLRGNEQYKYELGAKDYKLYTVELYF